MSKQIITTKSWQQRAWIAGLVTFAVLLVLGIGIVYQAMNSGTVSAQKENEEIRRIAQKNTPISSVEELVGGRRRKQRYLIQRKYRRYYIPSSRGQHGGVLYSQFLSCRT